MNIKDILPHLEGLPEWQRVPLHTRYEVLSLTGLHGQVLEKARRCESIPDFLRALPTLIRGAEELRRRIEDGFETAWRDGSWTFTSQEVLDRVLETLRERQVVNEIAEALYFGCECRKGKPGS
jgi:hypothetical protein